VAVAVEWTPTAKSIRVSPALRRRRLERHRPALQRRLDESSDPQSFLTELADIMSKTGGNLRAERGESPSRTGLRDGKFYHRVVAEIGTVGWAKLVSANDSLSRLILCTRDEAGREHRIDIELPADYPRSPPVCTTNLMQALVFHWKPNESSLRDAMHEFEKALASYQALWRVLEDIDTHTWVLEPERPTLSSSIRRIALGNHCSVQVVIDPAAPMSIPQCRFLGSEARVSHFREKLNSNIELWDEDDSFHNNLARSLECTLPGKEAAATEDRTNTGCGICYALRMKGDIPNILCPHASCNKAFHESCLVEWLRVLPTTRQSFGTLFEGMYNGAAM